MTSRRAPALAAIGALALSACGSGGAAAGANSRLSIVASFYPLQYIAQRIGGERVDVRSLTKPGAEPHDLELTPQDVAGLQRSDLVVYTRGFQPAVDDAVSTTRPPAVFDAATSADLSLRYVPILGGSSQVAGAGTDPHFWLDPARLSAVATALTSRLKQVAPADAATFEANAKALRSDLAALDAEFRTGLAKCANRDLVTSHNAFGYLAQRYGLQQVGITGLIPQAEPSPRRLADVAKFVRTNRVRTIYYETLVSPAVAKTLARETGATTAVLDPLEGLNDQSRGTNYLEVMRSNLTTLRKGQPCS